MEPQQISELIEACFYLGMFIAFLVWFYKFTKE